MLLTHTSRLYKYKTKKIIKRHNAYKERQYFVHPSPQNLEMKHNSYFVGTERQTYVHLIIALMRHLNFSTLSLKGICTATKPYSINVNLNKYIVIVFDYSSTDRLYSILYIDNVIISYFNFKFWLENEHMKT